MGGGGGGGGGGGESEEEEKKKKKIALMYLDSTALGWSVHYRRTAFVVRFSTGALRFSELVLSTNQSGLWTLSV